LTTSAITARPEQNTFGIYLIAEPVDARTLARNPRLWKELALSGTPVISEADIISYDFSTHAMRLSIEAIKRLPKPPVTGTAFVVMVNGERIYQGAFYSTVSSIPYSQPVIVVDESQPDQPGKTDVLLIDRAYPASFATGRDLRSDDRIKSVLSKLKKLAQVRQIAPNQAVTISEAGAGATGSAFVGGYGDKNTRSCFLCPEASRYRSRF
jgi:hypothetical protein